MSLFKFGMKKRRPNMTNVANGSTAPTIDASGIEIHPNGNFVAVATAYSTTQITVWSWNGVSTVSEVETISLSTSEVYCVRWHPNGNYLAVNVRDTSTSGGSVRVYAWNGSDTLTLAASQTYTPVSSYYNFPYGVDWHVSGNYLAATFYDNYAGATTVRVYSWNGSNAITEVATVASGAVEIACKWAPSGNYLYIGGGQASKGAKVYSWNGTDTLTEVASYNTGNYPDVACWTPDDSYLFVPQPTTTTGLQVFRFNGSSLTRTQVINSGLSGYETRIHGTGLVAFGGYQATPSTAGDYLKLYYFNKTTELLTEVNHLAFTGYGIEAISFDKGGRFLAAAGYGVAASFYMVKIYS